LYIETRPRGDKNEQQVIESPVQSNGPTEEEVVTLFLRVEVPEVLKHSSLKEEIVVKKKMITETKKISEQLRSEKVNIEGATEEQGKAGRDNAISE
jgi:stress response protein YsnF